MKQPVISFLDGMIVNYPDLAGQKESITAAFNIISGSYRNGGKLLVCGNGGSAADSEHMVAELMKEFRLKRPIPEKEKQKISAANIENSDDLCNGLQGALPAISLVNETSLFTAFINDVNADMVFAQQVYGYGRKGDVLLAISTSGNSSNIVNAVNIAKVKGLTTIGLTGSKLCKLQEICDVTISAPSKTTYRIQEYHQPIYHALCAMLEEEFFGNG